MSGPISSQFFLNLEAEHHRIQRDLTFYEVARVVSYVGLATLFVSAVIVTHLFAPHLTFLVLPTGLALVPIISTLATQTLTSKITKLREGVHHFSNAAFKMNSLHLDPVSARLRQIEEDCTRWQSQREALVNRASGAENPYPLRKKAYQIHEFHELPLKIQAAYLKHLLHHPTEARALSEIGYLHVNKSYKRHLDAVNTTGTPRPFFIKRNGERVSRQIIENETTDAVRIHLFGR